jgi:hypothetical protein
MNNKADLPEGWIQFRLDGSTQYKNTAEGLTVRKFSTRWMVIHRYVDTGKRFMSAQQAIEYAEQLRKQRFAYGRAGRGPYLNRCE